MRIAMVGPFGFHPNKTMRSRAFQFARALVQQGHQVGIFMPPWHTPKEAGRQWNEDGVYIEYVSLAGGVIPTTVRLVRGALAFRANVVHCFKPKAYSGLVAWWLWQTRRNRLPLVVDSDDWEGPGGWNDLAPYSPVQRRFFAWQERWGLRHCHALTVASKTLQSLAWAHGAPAERVHYIPNGPGIGTDTSGFADRRAELGLAGRPVVLLYSRLFEFDMQQLVAVLRRVQAHEPALAILAVGGGLFAAQAQDLRSQLAEAGLLSAFVDVGWRPEGELPALLAAADVGVYLMADTLLNRTKCPVKLADMAAVGLPVVAEAVGQVPEYVIPERTGKLREVGDEAGIATDIVSLFRNDELRLRLGEGARAHIAANFEWKRLAERLLCAYETVTRM
jgi:glycosyltransferase involved in cell wall biosynthesis